MHTNRLTELREARQLRRLDIAYELDVDPSTVWRWENTGAIPDDKKLELARFYEVEPAYLMGWDREERAA